MVEFKRYVKWAKGPARTGPLVKFKFGTPAEGMESVPNWLREFGTGHPGLAELLCRRRGNTTALWPTTFPPNRTQVANRDAMPPVVGRAAGLRIKLGPLT